MDATSRLSRHLPGCLAIVVLLLLVQGCTNSKLIIGPLYNRLDNQMRDQFNELGDFNQEQTAAFEARLGNYHVWHRQSELPQYASLMKSVAASIDGSDTTADQISRWFDTAEGHSLRVRQCHPVNFMFDFMKSLSDEQVTFIENHFKQKQLESLQRYQSRTPDERIERRLGNIVKWAGRINLELTPAQRKLLRNTFEQQTSMRGEYYVQSAQWNKTFFALAREQNDPDFDLQMSAHIDSLWQMMETTYPQQWQSNQNLWKQSSLELVQSMTREQRRIVSKWLKKMSSTVEAISQDKPSFQYVHDASLGCLINPDKS